MAWDKPDSRFKSVIRYNEPHSSRQLGMCGLTTVTSRVGLSNLSDLAGEGRGGRLQEVDVALNK